MHKCSDICCNRCHCEQDVAHKRPGAAPLNFPTTVRPDLRNMRGLGARVAESVRWSA